MTNHIDFINKYSEGNDMSNLLEESLKASINNQKLHRTTLI